MTMRPNWHGCYDDGWQGLIVEDAFEHPARFARGLIERIINHAVERSWIGRGSVILDPFGGVGCGGIVAATKGMRWIGVELEPRFVEMADRNFEMHRVTWETFGDPRPTMVCGDSRRLCEVVGPQADCVVSSPPYAQVVTGKNEESETAKESREKRRTPGGSLGRSERFGGYGVSDGQLGAMKPGDVDAVVSSPPFMKQQTGSGLAKPDAVYGPDGHSFGNIHGYQNQGESNGQLAIESGETFWQSAREIVAQCVTMLRPGGHAIWVTKDFVRKGARVPFSDDWVRLCESAGLTLVCLHRAMLVKETEHAGLFGDVVERKERKSFFRRLAEQKGAPPIDWEDVMCFEKVSQ